MRLRKGLQNEESTDGSWKVCSRKILCDRQDVCCCGFQDAGHKTPSEGLKIMIHVQGYIKDYDVVPCGTSATSELTQQSGFLTRLASDLGRACHKYICTVPL
jgi:hypothetical protein